MSGARRAWWFDKLGIPKESWDPILSAADGFEDYIISHLDAEARKRQFVAILSPTERHVLLLLLRGEKAGRRYKNTVGRIRKKAGTIWPSILLP